jgi:acyl-coenzyme A synthetase/AMP-(fatty) acid ligase
MTEAAVVSIPDDVLGEAVCLFAVHPSGSKIDASLESYCQQQLDHTLLPKKIVYMDTLPRNNSGKVDKLALKETLQLEVSAAKPAHLPVVHNVVQPLS